LHVKNALGLKNVLVENKRLESIKKIEETYLVCRAFMAPRLFAETVKDKISKDTKVMVMTSEEERFSLDGFKTRFIKSEAAEFLNKKRGFLEFQKT
jgi:16S rRNA G527 N7-methylase RsmG